jgi:hypothetical protein
LAPQRYLPHHDPKYCCHPSSYPSLALLPYLPYSPSPRSCPCASRKVVRCTYVYLWRCSGQWKGT